MQMQLGLPSLGAILLGLGMHGQSLAAAKCGASVVPGMTYEENISMKPFHRASALQSAGFVTAWASGIYTGNIHFEIIGKKLRYHIRFHNGGTTERKLLLAIYKGEHIAHWVPVTAKAGATGSDCVDDDLAILSNGDYHYGVEIH